MSTWHEALQRARADEGDAYRPVILRPVLADDRKALEALLERSRPVVHDRLQEQLRELIRVLNPAVRLSTAELDAAAEAHLGGVPAADYGAWVYYPWSNRLVHLLDEEEFVRVRTDRNRNKITREEQERLATKRVGVIGLSVGQSVSLTMAMERSFGEIRLADFDTLDLSNLNRIRAGVHELGSPKAINTAREIAELDPYLKVVLFTEGITPDNLDAFLTGGGKLDLLVEECDSVGIKILARQKARAFGIPVVMDTSDRGLLDIERFDLEPDRPLLHGTMEHLDVSLAMRATTAEEKLPFVIPLIGLENLSPRMKASMLEIESTVTSWPQLASAIAYGGGTGAQMSRRILLGEEVPSGRWWLDPDAAVKPIGIANTDHAKDQESHLQDSMPPRASSAGGNPPAVPGSEEDARVPMTTEEARQLALAGSLAPSGGNCQPWRFVHAGGRLLVFLDRQRAQSALDPGWRYAYLALGACIENIALSATQSGLQVSILRHEVRPDDLVATVELRERGSAEAIDMHDRRLAQAIPMRCTNRKDSQAQELTDGEAEALASVLQNHSSVSLRIIRDRKTIDHIAALCGRAERIRALNNTCHHDMFVKEMRWTQEEAERTADGIDIDTLELSLPDRVGLRVASDPGAMKLLRSWGTGRAIEKLTAKGIRASAALAILSAEDLGLGNAFEAGRALERFWLQATAEGIQAHPVGAPIFMGIHGRWDEQGILSGHEHREAEAILKELIVIAGLNWGDPIFMLRLGRAGSPTRRSLRKPLEELFVTKESLISA